jgi:hypothetical protein
LTKPLYFYNGTTFEQVGPTTPQSPIAYQTSAPTGPATGDLWIDSDGDVDTYNRQLTRYYFVATAAQTTITGTDANGLTLAYVAGSEAVYVNGALQVRGQDYTATNGTSVVLTAALAVNDVVEIFAYTAFTVANAYTKTETDGVAAAAAGLRMVVPTSVAVGSGTGSVDAIGNVTFTTASSISLNGCFDGTYDDYVIKVILTSVSATMSLNMRLRVSGADNSSSNYASSLRFIDSSSNNLFDVSAVSQSTWKIGGAFSGFPGFAEMSINTPFSSAPTNMMNRWVNNRATTGAVENYYGASSFGSSTSFTGFTLYPNTGTMTGTVRVYGYKD